MIRSLIITLMLLAASAIAQSFQGFTYQAVVRNMSDQLFVNQLVRVGVSILSESFLPKVHGMVLPTLL